MFAFDGYSQPVTGRAIAHCVNDEGETIAPVIDMKTASQLIRFVEPVRLPDQSVCLRDSKTQELAEIPDTMSGLTVLVWMSPAEYRINVGGGL